MSARIPALVKPQLIRWARTSAGMDVAQAARKARISQEKLQAWETEKDRPTIIQLRKLGEIYKRPLAVFYLPEPPRDFQVESIRDFRRLPDSVAASFSAELRFEIRRRPTPPVMTGTWLTEGRSTIVLMAASALLDLNSLATCSSQSFSMACCSGDSCDSLTLFLRRACRNQSN